jgi:hypothetical protein
MNESGNERKSETLANKVSVWVGIISVLSTLILSIFTFQINTQRQKAEDNQRITQNKLDEVQKEFQRQLEEKKFQKEKYQLVSTIIPDLTARDKDIKINLIRLILGDEEASRLFLGLQFSTDAKSKEIGNIGSNTIKDIYSKASDLENKGFEALINGKDEEAIQAFKEAEKVSPQFRSVFEISRLLEQNRSELADINTRKSVLQKLVTEYQVPTNSKKKILDLSR